MRLCSRQIWSHVAFILSLCHFSLYPCFSLISLSVFLLNIYSQQSFTSTYPIYIQLFYTCFLLYILISIYFCSFSTFVLNQLYHSNAGLFSHFFSLFSTVDTTHYQVIYFFLISHQQCVGDLELDVQ